MSDVLLNDDYEYDNAAYPYVLFYGLSIIVRTR